MVAPLAAQVPPQLTFLYVHMFQPILFDSRRAIMALSHASVFSPVSPFHTGRLVFVRRSVYGLMAAALLLSQYLWNDQAIWGSHAGSSPLKPTASEDQLIPSKNRMWCVSTARIALVMSRYIFRSVPMPVEKSPLVSES